MFIFTRVLCSLPEPIVVLVPLVILNTEFFRVYFGREAPQQVLSLLLENPGPGSQVLGIEVLTSAVARKLLTAAKKKTMKMVTSTSKMVTNTFL